MQKYRTVQQYLIFLPERRNNYFDKQAKANRSGHCAYHRTIPEAAKV